MHQLVTACEKIGNLVVFIEHYNIITYNIYINSHHYRYLARLPVVNIVSVQYILKVYTYKKSISICNLISIYSLNLQLNI